MEALPQNTALIIIDVQKGFDEPFWGERNNPYAEENIAKLLKKWRETERPIIHIQHLSENIHSPLHPNQPGCEFKEIVKPIANEPVITKNVNSAFIGTNLEQVLREYGCTNLVIAGLTTNHCVSTTTRMAGNLGFTTFIVSDGTATFDRTGFDGKLYKAEDIHMISLVNLHEEFATVLSTNEVLGMIFNYASN